MISERNFLHGSPEERATQVTRIITGSHAWRRTHVEEREEVQSWARDAPVQEASHAARTCWTQRDAVTSGCGLSQAGI